LLLNIFKIDPDTVNNHVNLIQ